MSFMDDKRRLFYYFNIIFMDDIKVDPLTGPQWTSLEQDHLIRSPLSKSYTFNVH